MAPANICVSQQLRQLIYYHIDNNLLRNALFFAERLLAYDPRSTESAYLLALCHLRLGDPASAYEYSKPAGSRGTHLACAYVYAQACLALERYKDGITALEKSRGLWGGKNGFGKHTQSSRLPIPDAAAVSCLLGKLHLGYDDKKKAITHFEVALKLNPFMWDAFTTLSEMSVPVKVENIFKMTSELEAVIRTNAQEHQDILRTKDEAKGAGTDQALNRPGVRHTSNLDSTDPFSVPSRSFGGGLFGSLGLSPKLSESNPSLTNFPATSASNDGEGMETPTISGSSIDVTMISNRREPGVVSAYSLEPPQAPMRKKPGFGMDFSMEVPRMARNATSKRSQKTQDVVEDSAATQALRSATLAPDRKRTISGQVVPRQTSEDPGAPQRRSVRLINQFRPTSSKSSGNVQTISAAQGRELKKARPQIGRIMRPNTGTSTAGRQVSGNRKPIEQNMDVDQEDVHVRPWNQTNIVPAPHVPQISPEFDPVKQREAIQFLLELFHKFGKGFVELAKFQSTKALLQYRTLPASQQETPWVLAQIGRAHYEQADYQEAEKYYKRLRQVAPTRFDDMEIYSTILWFLKRETDLAFLAHELIDASWQSPQAWCAIGNSWSLARDHEQALRCFKRATQLNPKFAYAFTLQGHEHVENEEYDKALTSYHQATAADKKHYNAYYGLGRVYERLGNYEKAYRYFGMASHINSTNAVLICCLGTVLHKQGHKRQALEQFTRAIELAPLSIENRLRKAKALKALGNMDEALKELIVLKDRAPEDSRVHYLLAELYKVFGEKGKAVRHYTSALNLDPKVGLITCLEYALQFLIFTGQSRNQGCYGANGTLRRRRWHEHDNLIRFPAWLTTTSITGARGS